MTTPLMVDKTDAGKGPGNELQYGTIASFRIKPGCEQALAEAAEEWKTDSVGMPPQGFIARFVYRMNSAENLYSLVVVFASKADYEANAVSPRQHERYLEFRSFLQADPEWHDGEIVDMAVTN